MLVTVTATEKNNEIVSHDMLGSECLCPNKLIFECTITINSTEESLLWNGSAFSNCGIVLQPFLSWTRSECNEGAIVGSIMGDENSGYLSQLNVTLNFEVIGKNILCFHINSDVMGQNKVIGNFSITGL